MVQNELFAQMVDSLRAVNGLNLKDERACMKALSDAGFRSGDVVALVDRVMAEASHRGLKLAGIIGDAASMIAAVGAWLAWYVVLCPAGA